MSNTLQENNGAFTEAKGGALVAIWTGKSPSRLSRKQMNGASADRRLGVRSPVDKHDVRCRRRARRGVGTAVEDDIGREVLAEKTPRRRIRRSHQQGAVGTLEHRKEGRENDTVGGCSAGSARESESW